MSERARHVRDAVAAAVALAALLPGAVVTAQPSSQRLLVFDVPFARVWERTIQEMKAYPVARVGDGVIETARAERAPLSREAGAERVAERITIRVEAVAETVTRVTATVDAEAWRDGRWQPFEGSSITTRTVLDRIRAGLRKGSG